MEDYIIVDDILNKNCSLEEMNLDHEYAFFSKNAERQKIDDDDGFSRLRNCFAHDTDRIIHSHAFARYMDKTQVFFQIKNDHISRRSLHVQMVSRIARTIGRCLQLNEDLIEAIAIGHDIGHTPFGHAGEYNLANILKKRNKGYFVHNAQSVRILQMLENHGNGLNLTLPVLDGILGHNGEIESMEYRFESKNLTWEKLKENLDGCLSIEGFDKNVFPSTLEGCVVRVADIISYLGKDFEDAITLKLIDREELPFEIVRVLGMTNREIVGNLCNDIIVNSYKKGCICFSEPVYEAYRKMKEFNYAKIYNCGLLIRQKEKFEKMVSSLFDVYIDDIEHNRTEMDIFKHFLSCHTGKYIETEPPERMVADYIAGMTDHYFLKQYELRFIPQLIDYDAIEKIAMAQDGLPPLKSKA